MTLHHFNYITDMLQTALAQAQVARIRGKVVEVTGTIIRAVIPSVKIGEICLLRSPGDECDMKAEVVGFDGDENAGGSQRVTAVRLAGGETVPADFVIVGIGVRSTGFYVMAITGIIGVALLLGATAMSASGQSTVGIADTDLETITVYARRLTPVSRVAATVTGAPGASGAIWTVVMRGPPSHEDR